TLCFHSPRFQPQPESCAVPAGNRWLEPLPYTVRAGETENDKSFPVRISRVYSPGVIVCSRDFCVGHHRTTWIGHRACNVTGCYRLRKTGYSRNKAEYNCCKAKKSCDFHSLPSNKLVASVCWEQLWNT